MCVSNYSFQKWHNIRSSVIWNLSQSCVLWPLTSVGAGCCGEEEQSSWVPLVLPPVPVSGALHVVSWSTWSSTQGERIPTAQLSSWPQQVALDASQRKEWAVMLQRRLLCLGMPLVFIVLPVLTVWCLCVGNERQAESFSPWWKRKVNVTGHKIVM